MKRAATSLVWLLPAMFALLLLSPAEARAQRSDPSGILGFAHFLLDGILTGRPEHSRLASGLQRLESAPAQAGSDAEAAFVAALDSALTGAVRAANPGLEDDAVGVAAMIFAALHQAKLRIDALDAKNPDRVKVRSRFDAVHAAYRRSLLQPAETIRELEDAIGEAESRGRE